MTTAMALCVLCGSFTVAFAAPEDTTETITEVETSEEVTEEDTTLGLIIGEPDTESDETTPATTKPKVTKPVTTEKTTKEEKTTRKNNKTTTQKEEPDEQDPDEDEEVDDVVAQQTSETTEETTLPEGSFYVYLELNNGQPRLKRILKEAGLVPEPKEPVREGYIFDGWYADAKFTKPWNFFSSVADEKTVIYAKWIADGSVTVYNIKISETTGGTLEAHPTTASEGEPVIITVLPEEGKRIVSGSLKINGKQSDVFSFIMPAEDVVVEAMFEDIPESELVDEEDKSVLPFIIGAGIVIIAIIVVVMIILKRRADMGAVEFDENGAVIIDDYDDDTWVDESIVIEDGFLNGKIVKENVEPDYSQPEEDDLI